MGPSRPVDHSKVSFNSHSLGSSKRTRTDVMFIYSGAWLIVPSYMIYQLGSELFDAVNIASRATGSTKYD